MGESEEKIIIVEAPIRSYSFFGIKSRQIVKALKKIYSDCKILVYEYFDEYRNGYCDNSIDELIVERNDNVIPDIWIQVGHPSIFYRKGVKNIGITSSYIYTPISSFIDGCNNTDVILTFSRYSADNIKKFEYNNGQETVKVVTPVMVMLEYSDIIPEYKKTIESPLLKNINTDWNFLVCGQWEVTDGVEFGGNNKDNISFIIRSFLSTFAGTDLNVGLILNVHGIKSSILDNSRLTKIINNIKHDINITSDSPNIYLINDELTIEEKASLYNDPRVKCLISIPQRSDSVQEEMDFIAAAGKPIIYSNFTTQKLMFSYAGNIAINGNSVFINNDQRQPEIIDSYTSELKLSMYDIYHHYNDILNYSTANANIFNENFNQENFISVFQNILQGILKF